MSNRPTVRSFAFRTSTGKEVTVAATESGHGADVTIGGGAPILVNAETLVTLRQLLASHLTV